MTEAPANKIMMAMLLALLTVIMSLGSALLLNVEPYVIDRLMGAAWAWAIGYATAQYWTPWVKEAV